MIDDHTRLEAAFRGRQPDSGWGFIAIGVVMSFVGGVSLVDSTDSGLFAIVLFSIGSLFASIGVVAVGVTTGIRRAEYLSARQLLAQLHDSDADQAES